MIFKWRDNYGMNIEKIDVQHRKLFEIGTKVYEVASLKDDCDHYDEIMDVLTELKEYTVEHFQYEEELMKKYGYKDYEIHKMEHDFFIKKVDRIEKKDIDGAQQEAIIQILQFVADWVSSHILKTDIQYKDFFIEHGINKE